ncbi:MAG TPA: large conductance mechanosensitive channel protein MscL [Microbacteriaceae bacterium]|nr:large conductance mechanosensitive channel protein MscL [Microbacteriaceae bacterium]
MIKGFKEFILRGNVLDLAIAVVIGAAFGAVVTSLVDKVFNPLIGALFNAEGLATSFPITIPTSSGGHATIYFGAVIAALINFLLVALLVYFVFVLPMNTYSKRQKARRQAGEPEPEDTPVTELEMLTQIRDLLADVAVPGASRHTASKHTAEEPGSDPE